MRKEAWITSNLDPTSVNTEGIIHKEIKPKKTHLRRKNTKSDSEKEKEIGKVRPKTRKEVWITATTKQTDTLTLTPETVIHKNDKTREKKTRLKIKTTSESDSEKENCCPEVSKIVNLDRKEYITRSKTPRQQKQRLKLHVR